MKFARRSFLTRSRVAIAAALALGAIGAGVVAPNVSHAAPVVNVSSPSVIEGTTGTSPVTVTFTLSEANESPVTVTYATKDGTATEPADYVKQSGTVEFPAHTTSRTVTFSAKGDVTDEDNETFIVELLTVSGGYGKGTNGTVTITDDDEAPSVVIDDAAKLEGDIGTSSLPFTLRLSAPSGKVTTVNVSTQNRRDPLNPIDAKPPKATAGSDYTALSNVPVTFAIGQTTATVNVPIKGDLINELNEQFEVQLSAATGGNLQTPNDFGVGTITNDDPLPRIDISDGSSPEGALNCGTSCNQITFTLTLSAPSDKTVSVDYATEDRSASSSSDYVPESGSSDDLPESTAIEFAPGVTSVTETIDIRGDNTAEPSERFALNLSNPENAELGDAQGFGLIINDDGGSFPTVSVANAPDAFEATNGTANSSTFTITATNWPLGNTSTVTVFYTTADGPEGQSSLPKATAASDYIATSGSVQIPWSPTGSNTATVTVPLRNDSTSEPDEYFQLQITDSNAEVTDATGQAKIRDDDPQPKVSIAAATTKNEGTGANEIAQIPVTLSAASANPITVGYSTPQPNSGTATVGDDYNNTTGSITFEPGQTSKVIELTVVADAIDEANETVNVVLNGPTNASIDQGSGTLTITDDDVPPTISIGGITVTEGNSGATNATFPVTLSGPSGKPITVQAATADGTATAPGDYTSKTETLTLAPGTTTADFVVTVVSDIVDEANETFTATLSSANNATAGTMTGTATIEDDDDAPTGTTTTTTTSTTSTTLPGNASGAKMTTTPGAGGGPHVRQFNPNGTATGPGFFDGDETTGKRVARGDLDGDGQDEIITAGGRDSSGYVSAYTATGGFITSVQPYGASFRGGIFVAAGDVDGDGDDEVITGAGSGGGPHVRTFSFTPATGDTPPVLNGSAGFYAFPGTFGGGVTVGAGDLNGDDKAEILAGQSSAGSVVRSFAYTGTGSATQGLEIAPYGGFLGGAFVAAGDLTGDGNAEIVTATGPGGGGDPHLRTFTPAGAAIGNGIYAYNVGFRGGFSVAVGDLNDDGEAEIVTGAGPTGGPHVKVWNDALQMQREFFAYTANFLGGVWVAVGES